MSSPITTIWGFAIDGWLILLFGIGVGLFFIPWVINWIEKSKEYERFYRDCRSEGIGKARSTFFRYLCRAYHGWRQTHPNGPESLEDLIDQTAYPNWIPELDGELIDVIKQNFVNPGGPPLWKFSNDLYSLVDAFIKSRDDPNLLSPDEADAFHDARQTLSYFWEDTATVVLKMRKLRYRLIKRHLKSDERLLKVLCFLSLALHLENNQKGQGGKHMYYLCGIYFGTKKWGIRQWINSPLLEPSEKWRV